MTIIFREFKHQFLEYAVDKSNKFWLLRTNSPEQSKRFILNVFQRNRLTKWTPHGSSGWLKKINVVSYAGFFAFSSTADAGRFDGDGDVARLPAPRDTFIFPLFLPVTLVALAFPPIFCFSFFVCSAFFESIFAGGVGDTDSAAISFVVSSSSSSSFSKISVLSSCPLNATLQNGVSASDERKKEITYEILRWLK